MPAAIPLNVCIHRPGKPLAEAMNEVRAWLDRNKIVPSEFKFDTDPAGVLIFNLRFAAEDDARLFGAQFPA